MNRKKAVQPMKSKGNGKCFKPKRELSCESLETREHWLIKELLNEFVNEEIGRDMVKRRTVVWINLASRLAHAPRRWGSPCSRKDNR